MAEANLEDKKTKIDEAMEWVDARFPATETWEYHLSKYWAPKNHNYYYVFGFLGIIVLVNQLLTGIWLTMNYVPTDERAFASVEYIMRDVNYGWLVRYLHSTGASAFFVVTYIHMYRALAYGSYKAPRELLWFVGMAIFLVLMAEGFMGYLLPWGNMSYWGAQVIISLFGAIPFVGPDVVEWARGDFLMSEVALNRFFALHVVLLPLLLVALVFVHIVALHHVGSNNPDGIEIKKKKDNQGIPLDGIPFWPYSIVKDLFALSVFLFIFLAIVFFAPRPLASEQEITFVRSSLVMARKASQEATSTSTSCRAELPLPFTMRAFCSSSSFSQRNSDCSISVTLCPVAASVVQRLWPTSPAPMIIIFISESVHCDASARHFQS